MSRGFACGVVCIHPLAKAGLLVCAAPQSPTPLCFSQCLLGCGGFVPWELCSRRELGSMRWPWPVDSAGCRCCQRGRPVAGATGAAPACAPVRCSKEEAALSQMICRCAASHLASCRGGSRRHGRHVCSAAARAGRDSFLAPALLPRARAVTSIPQLEQQSSVVVNQPLAVKRAFLFGAAPGIFFFFSMEGGGRKMWQPS